MPLKLQPTLDEMVSAVLDGLGLGVQGAQTAYLHPLVKRNLRMAQAALWNRFPWLQNRVVQTITTESGVTDYDLPEGFEPGALRRVYARSRRNDDTVVEWDLDAGIDPSDRTRESSTSSADGIPYAYALIDGVMRVHPAPTGDDDSLPPELRLEMDSGQAPLIQGEERPAVDGEACIQLATILTKEARRMPVGDEERNTHRDYVMSLRGKQREPRVFTLGTDWRHPAERQPNRRKPYDRDNWTPSASA